MPFLWNLEMYRCEIDFYRSVHLFSHVQLFVTPWTAACQAPLSITNSWSLLRLMSIESVMPSNHRILCPPLLLLPSIFPSIRVFSNESAFRIRWPKYWSFSFSISPSSEHPGLISFRMDWLDLLAVQGTLKSLLQHQFKSINSLALSFLHSPTLTSIHDHCVKSRHIHIKEGHLLNSKSASLSVTLILKAPSWKKSSDKPRQHIKKQRHYFANKGPSNQSYGFSSSHV